MCEANRTSSSVAAWPPPTCCCRIGRCCWAPRCNEDPLFALAGSPTNPTKDATQSTQTSRLITFFFRSSMADLTGKPVQTGSKSTQSIPRHWSSKQKKCPLAKTRIVETTPDTHKVVNVRPSNRPIFFDFAHTTRASCPPLDGASCTQQHSAHKKRGEISEKRSSSDAFDAQAKTETGDSIGKRQNCSLDLQKPSRQIGTDAPSVAPFSPPNV